MTYPMARMIADENAGLAGREISHHLNNIVIKALFIAAKNSLAAETKKIYDEIFINGMDNKPALIKWGMLQKPLDVYVAVIPQQQVVFISLSLVSAYILPEE